MDAPRFICADRYCTTGWVAREGDVCEDCKPRYHAADLAGEDEAGLDYARKDKEWARW